MWYRAGKPAEESTRTAAPWGWSLRKRKKRKTKHFDLPGTDEMPIQESIEPPVTDTPKMPTNTVETPDLPAGVKIPPVKLPETHHPLIDEEHKKPALKHNTNKKPKELIDLYGPDHDIDDDSVINTPVHPKDLHEIHKPRDLEPEIEEKPVIEPEIEEPEEPEPDLEIEPEEPEEIDQSAQPVPNPPIHEFCHCEIITMPGGRRIWRANDGACNDCLTARDTFNQWQLSLFGS